MMRYEGKPFLRYLDHYVLRAIGQLGPQHEATLAEMSESLSGLYGQGEWFDIVALRMNLEADYPARIAEIWQSAAQSSQAQGIELDPIEFTRLFVDANFPS